MICDKCAKRQAVYTRKYSGEQMCSECFSNAITRKAAKTISKHTMISNGDLVAVAVSGGKDSLALLKIMHAMASTHNFTIRAITIDEGIPGYRSEALGIVEEFCGRLGVEHDVYSYSDLFGLTLEDALESRQNTKVGGVATTSSCSICGTLRRKAISHAAAEINADVVATGHNLDDTLQTFLINMLSGDIKKIGWMDPDAVPMPPSSSSPPQQQQPPASPVRRIKPFCEIYEEEIVFYAFTNDLPFQSEPCPHMNEGIRTEIREFINQLEQHHSGIKNSMHRSILRMSQIVRDVQAGQIQKNVCSRCGSMCTGNDECAACEVVQKLGTNNENIAT